MKRAYIEIRHAPHYRRDAFVAGLRVAGFLVQESLPTQPPAPDDVLVIWNRYSDKEVAADKWEKQGGQVLVAENGYCGRDAQGRQHYALALHGHNGSGQWYEGGPERWDALGIALQPWRERGETVLVCPNRNFGMRGLAMPYGWEKDIVARLRKRTSRPIRVRPHPNGSAPSRPLADDLNDAHCVVIWSSSCGVHALIAGVPVVAESPWWICKSAALDDLKYIDSLNGPGPWENMGAIVTRRQALQRLAWAQWTIEEIADGTAFSHLLRPAEQGQVAAGA